MIKRLLSSLLLAVIAISLISGTVWAFLYRAPVSVTENSSTDYGQIAVLWNSPNTWLAANGFMSSTALDTRVETLGGLEYPWLVADNKTLTAIPVPADSQTNLFFTTGNSAATDMDIIVGYGGYITTLDNDPMEPGADFEFELSGYINTDNGTDKNLIHKEDAFRTYVSDTVSGNITAEILDDSYATVQATNKGNTDTDSHTVSLPAGIVSGDLLIAYFANNTDTVTVTWPGGWTQLFSSTNAGSHRLSAAYRIADGGEGGSITVTTSVVEEATWVTYRIDGYSGVPEVGTAVAADTSDSPNPPSLTASWGSLENLWFAIESNRVFGSDSGRAVTALPTNYGNEVEQEVANYPYLSIARRSNETATEDPGVFTLSDVSDWIAQTIVVKPAFTAAASVSATGVSSGEHDVAVGMDSPFFGMSVDADLDLPVTTGLVLNDPLWQTECSSSPFNSIDTTGVANAVSGAVWTLNEGYDFDGVDDYIEVAHDASQLLTTGGSVEAWIKPDSVGELDGRIVDKSNGLYGTDGYSFGVTPTNRAWFLIGDVGAGSIVFSADNSVIFGDGNWYHVMATWTDTGLVTIYINGAVSGTPGISADPAGITTTNALRIGNRSGATDRTFDGLIGEVRIYDFELTQEQVIQDYNASKSKYDTGDIYIHSTTESVPDNANDWIFMDNSTTDFTPYWDYYEHTVGGTLIVDYEPVTIISGTTLPDKEGVAQNGIITWGANPAGVAATLGSMTSSGQPSIGGASDTSTNDLLPVTGGTDWRPDPGVSAKLQANPLRPIVTAISDNTTLSEYQVWVWLGIIFVVFITVLVGANARGHHLLTGIAATAAILLLVIWTVFPYFVLLFAVIAMWRGVVSERTLSL